MRFSFKHFFLFIALSLVLISCGTMQRGKIKYHSATNHSTHSTKQEEKMQALYVADKVEASNLDVSSENVLMRGVTEHKVLIENKRQDLPCDTLLLKNGKITAVLVQEIKDTYIVYKMCEEQAGEDYLIKTNLVASIRKANGSVTNLNDQSEPGSSQSKGTENPEASDKLALTAAVMGGLAFIPVIGWIFALISFIVGGIALSRIKKYPADYKGAKLARRGITLGVIALLLGILVLALTLALFGVI